MSNYFNAKGTIGFTCDNCGRELLGCTWVNGMKFCAKCYQETFGNTNPFEKELRDKIADLEAKLAESEKKFNVANNLRKNSDEVLLNYKTEKYGLDKTIKELRKMKLSLPEKEWYYKGFENCERQMSSHIADLTLEVKELKQQLAESEEELKDAEEHIDALELQLREQYQLVDEKDEQLAEKDKELKNIVEGLWTRKWANKYYEMRRKEQPKLLFPDSDEVYQRYFELKQQLAEKDKAYQELLNSIKIEDLSNINFIQVNDDVVRFSESGVIYEYNKKDNAIYKIIDQAHQDKISFCIEKLEKVKEYIDNHKCKTINDNRYVVYRKSLVDIIDNQIKQLKEGK